MQKAEDAANKELQAAQFRLQKTKLARKQV
jgi:hypothetical protein